MPKLTPGHQAIFLNLAAGLLCILFSIFVRSTLTRWFLRIIAATLFGNAILLYLIRKTKTEEMEFDPVTKAIVDVKNKYLKKKKDDSDEDSDEDMTTAKKK